MGARSRSGCLSCRRRKKKCDETKPICAACLRNALKCVWPDTSPLEASSEVVSTPQQQTQTFSARPVPASDAWALTIGAPRNLPTVTIPASPSNFPLLGSAASGSETWRLLDHYLKDTANRLACLQDSENPFLHTILPVALSDELVMNSILALSGVHMMQRLPRLNLEMQSLTWSRYTRALRQLRMDLSETLNDGSNVDAAWRALLVVLIFYLLEATRGNDPKAMQRHLDGAHHLMAHVLRSTETPTQPSIVSFTIELYVYNAALASFTTNSPPALIMSPSLGLKSLGGADREIGVLCGCAYELFTLVPHVSALLRNSASCDSSTTSSKDGLMMEYYSIRAQIENWKPRSNQRELVLCAELYQQSLLLLLDYRFTSNSTDDIVDNAFWKLNSIISQLPPNSPIATTANWPLFAFGIHARKSYHREIIRSYLRSLVEYFGMGVMSTALRQLEELWMSEPGQDVISKFFTNQNELLLIC
ncbi:Putative ZYRO0G12584p [Penicillium brasilianum]|uniref:Putative ZYRO0G12584p n=1 Tax=Penicillium brasilianum TaxID=104259 RepID=A0A0F7TD12_PENBI|nr:Putative ZYRO0G12584p [Penicillium brasilianum]